MATDTISVEDLAQVQNVEFTLRFAENVSNLLAVLGVSESVPMALGTQLEIYKTSGALKSGTGIAEGEDIPISHYENKLDRTITLDFEKWRKQTTIEAIAKRGYTQAVTKTDNKMVKDIQMGVRNTFYNFLKSGTGTAGGDTFQAALANAWGTLEIKFEDTSATPVYFVNPMDIADYLGKATVSLQSAFGFSYIENFLGLGTVLVDSKVTQGSVIATAQENINVYHVDPGAIPGFDFYSDETGLIGIHHDTRYQNVAYETIAVSAFTLFPEYLDRIVIADITGEETPEP